MADYEYVTPEMLEDELDRRELALGGSISALWREVVILRVLLVLTGLALLLVTVAMAVRT